MTNDHSPRIKHHFTTTSPDVSAGLFCEDGAWRTLFVHIAINLEQQVIDGGMVSRVNHVQIGGTLHTSAMVTGNMPVSTANYKVSAAKLVEKENIPHLELAIDTDSSCGGSYYNVYASEAPAKSLPPQTTVSLQRLPENDDQCDNPVSYQVSVSLEKLVEKFSAN